MISPLDELKSHIKSKMKNEVEGEVAEGFKKKKNKLTYIILLLYVVLFLVGLFLVVYSVYIFIFQMECIIYNGKKPSGKIDWFGTVVPTVLLFMCCGPCMFLYRLFNRCTNKDMRNNVRNNTTRNNTTRNNTARNNSY